MRTALVGCIEVKIDDELYSEEVCAAWDAFDEGLAAEPGLTPGYGVLGHTIEDISFKLSCETGLDWESNLYGDLIITLHGGTDAQYAEYEIELINRIARYKRWAVVKED